MHTVQPFQLRTIGFFGRMNVNGVSAVKSMSEWTQFSVDFRRDREHSHVAVNLIRKVETIGTQWKIDDVALGCENENAVFKNIQLQVFNELLVAGYGFLNIQNLLHPLVLFCKFFSHLLLFLAFLGTVKIMRRNSVLVFQVHVVGSNLKLGDHAFQTENGSVNTLVTVAFGDGNEVFQTPDFRRETLMQNTEDLVTTSNVRHNRADSDKVVNFMKTFSTS